MGHNFVKEWYERGKGNVVESGRQTRFWKDAWIDECPLMVIFPNIYRICHDQEISVEAAANRRWVLDYRRRIGITELEEWNGLMEKLESVSLTEQNDRVIWKLEVLGKFSTRSIYRFITLGGVKDVRIMEIWSAKLPLKVQIFL